MSVGNGDVLRAAVVWSYNNSDEQVNVWHIGVNDVPVDETDLYDDIREYFLDLYDNITTGMVNELVHNRIELFNVSEHEPMTWITAQSGLDGTNTGEPLPTGVSALIYWRTSVSRVIGKKYLPTMGENTLDGGLWNSGELTALADIAIKGGQIFVGANGTQIRAGVMHNNTSFVHFASYHYTNLPAYQRRRKLGRGS